MTPTTDDYPPRHGGGYGPHPPHPRWPGGANIAVQFVLNYEEGGENNVLHGDESSETFLSEVIGAQAFPNRHMSMESLYEYGSRAGLWRVLRMFDDRRLPLTIFGGGHGTRPQPPQALAAFLARGDEIACHGLKWRSYQLVDEEAERADMAEAVRILTELTGSAPTGGTPAGTRRGPANSSSNTVASCTTRTPTPTTCPTGRGWRDETTSWCPTRWTPTT